jgi:hypothetical protein
MDINQTPSHFGKQFNSQILDWLPSDTKENYQACCRQAEYVKYIKIKGWDQPGAINYRINSLGFRGDEFDFSKPCLVALGCSFTIGTGLPEQTVWPWLVGAELNLPVINLSWGGYSADTCFRLAEYFLPKLNAELCVMMSPPPDRIEVIGPNIVTDTNFEVFMPQSKSYWFNPNDVYLKYWLSVEENSRLNNLKNKLAVEMLCSRLRIPCLTYDVSDFFTKSREEIEYARDYMHAGPAAHVAAAEKILNDCTQK